MSKYIEREALIAKMRTMPIPKQAGSGYTWLDNCAAGINSAIREVKSFPAADVAPVWISVNDRLPEAEYGESDSVLCVTKMGTQIVLYFDGGCWCRPTGETHCLGVTHWMPLPEPPDGGLHD